MVVWGSSGESSSARSSSRPLTSATTRKPPARSTSGTSSVTNGTSRGPAGVSISRVSWAGRCSTAETVRSRSRPAYARPEPDELTVVELLRLLGQLSGVDVGQQHRAAGLFGRGPVGELLELGQQPAGVLAGVGHGERTPGALGPQPRTGGEPALGLVGAARRSPRHHGFRGRGRSRRPLPPATHPLGSPLSCVCCTNGKRPAARCRRRRGARPIRTGGASADDRFRSARPTRDGAACPHRRSRHGPGRDRQVR